MPKQETKLEEECEHSWSWDIAKPFHVECQCTGCGEQVTLGDVVMELKVAIQIIQSLEERVKELEERNEKVYHNDSGTIN